jgi:plastocyanin
LVAVSCGSSDSTADSKTTSTTTAAKPRPAVTIETSDFSFTAPATIPAGYVDVTMKNVGQEGHQVQFVKLNGVSEADFTTAASNTDIGALADAVFVGGPNGADPGGSATATVKLDPGSYEIVCFIPGSDGKAHAAHGMIGKVEVKKTAASVETAPESDGTIVLSDFVFEPPTDFTGKGTFTVENKGSEVHELGLFKIADGKTIDDVKGYLLTPPGTPPPAGPPPFTSAGGTVGLSTNGKAWLTLDLTPGKYAMVCFFPDPKKDDIPHALEGMIKEITVS